MMVEKINIQLHFDSIEEAQDALKYREFKSAIVTIREILRQAAKYGNYETEEAHTEVDKLYERILAEVEHLDL